VTERSCRVCSCTHNKPCLDEKATALDVEPIGCHWVQRDLCNVCDERAQAIRLSDGQREQIELLTSKRAYTRLKSHYSRRVNVMLLAHLATKGLVQKATRRRWRAQRTYYWLTPLGREVGRRIHHARGYQTQKRAA